METNTETRFDKLYAKVLDVRAAQKAYYAYRPRTEMDVERKRELLDLSKRKERELDALMKELSTPPVPAQSELFS